MSRPLPPRIVRHLAAGQSFTCVHCGTTVPASAAGTENRNHCPRCLWSRHVDVAPGDRRSGCLAPMEPITVWRRAGGEWSLLHRCSVCGTIRANRIAGDDNEMLLLSIAARALAQPPFPLSGLDEGRFATRLEERHDD